ncbi:hypothetical protein [Pantoea stewartii]|uniref:hypothetical protein n=1 Tax=Pantoea stewartii TaxID=66269 RepID=UPI00162974A8|nr:hypothetical protein [Pantoea stewartii]MBC0853902.1 hypothetical protein [Pantoea stewartii]
MKIILVALSVFLSPIIAHAGNSDINEKAYTLCEKQEDFFFLSAVASTGRNIKMSTEYPETPEYRVLGRSILLSDKEIDKIVNAYASDEHERRKAIALYNSNNKRTAAIICSQIPAQRLVTYGRLKHAGYIE